MVAPERTYAEVLRVAGRYLAAQQARSFEIAERDEALALTWVAGSGDRAQHSYTRLELADLLAAARLLRGDALVVRSREQEQLLRTLGQELDRQHVTLGAVFQQSDGYRVLGEREGLPFEGHFSVAELGHLSAERHEWRASAEETPVAGSAPHEAPADAVVPTPEDLPAPEVESPEVGLPAGPRDQRPWWRRGWGR
jgi:hypothetical protein